MTLLYQNNRKCFLSTIAFSEGVRTGQHPLTKMDGYDVIVTGIDSTGKKAYELFTDMSDHPFAHGRPAKKISEHGLYSSAAGRYQQMAHDWPFYKAMLHLTDFGPAAQDLLALQHIRESHALDAVDEGRFKDAILSCRHIWASLPGADYGQHENNIDTLETVYLSYGGQLV